MEDLAGMLGGRIEMETNGKKYIFTEMTLDDWAELESWAKDRLIKDIQYQLQLLPPEEKELRSKLMAVFAMSKREIELESSRYMIDAAAAKYRAWLCLRKNHPGITEKEVGQLFAARTFNKIYDRLHGIIEKEGGENPVPPAGT